MAKQDEISYLKNIGQEGSEHAVNKPFSDADCGVLLTRIGIIMQFLPPPPAKILDMGCGTGWTSQFFAKNGYQVTGIDIAPDMIEQAQKNTSGNPKYIVSDYENFNLTERFDAVVFFDSLHHSEDEQAALSAAYTALKVGGSCILSEPGVGHSIAEASVRAMEEFGVNEKDMPPKWVRPIANSIGFKSFTVIPYIDQILASFYLFQGSRRIPWKSAQTIIDSLRILYLLIWNKRNNGLVVMNK